MKHELLQKLVLEFCKNYVEPEAARCDEEERFPIENVRKMGEYGLMGLIVPKELGGVGADYKAYIDTVRLLSRYCATTGTILSAHVSLCIGPILQFGTEEQKKKYVPSLAKGKKIGAFALTEAGAGSDASRQLTRAVLDNDHYVINGNKIFITNAAYADVFIVFAMTQPELGTKGISAFIVDRKLPGFSIGAKEKKMGIRGSSTCELVLQNVLVPATNLLGKEGEGFKIAMATLDSGRLGIASQAQGIAEGAFEKTVAYVKKRQQFGKPISALQNTQFLLAELATKIEAASLLLYKGVSDKEAGKHYSSQAAMAKLFCSKTAVEVSDSAIQLHGGYGYIRDFGIERYLRDAKITEIYEGTSEIQKLVIAGKVLK